jgi:hypothetical protein
MALPLVFVLEGVTCTAAGGQVRSDGFTSCLSQSVRPLAQPRNDGVQRSHGCGTDFRYLLGFRSETFASGLQDV